MNPSARLFFCARCHCQVIICRHCDRGQVYCAEGCADLARTASRRRAGQRYSVTLEVPTPSGQITVHWPINQLEHSIDWLKALMQ